LELHKQRQVIHGIALRDRDLDQIVHRSCPGKLQRISPRSTLLHLKADGQTFATYHSKKQNPHLVTVRFLIPPGVTFQSVFFWNAYEPPEPNGV
jgi:hypothetical protein